MASYSAVISLMTTIHRLLNSSRISFVSQTREILEFAFGEVKFLQDVLEKSEVERRDSGESESERVKALEGEMREAAFTLEDVLESHVSAQIVSQSEADPLLFSVELQELWPNIHSFSETARKMAECIKDLEKSPLSEDEEAVFSSTNHFGENMSEMVGFTDIFAKIRSALIQNWPEVCHVSIVGTAGIGKTFIAKKIFEDPLIIENFEYRIFVTVGPKCQSKHKSQFRKILHAIVALVNPESDITLVEGDKEFDDYFSKSLVDRKYLIVLDDVWGISLLSYLDKRLPEASNGSMILVTTRLLDVGAHLACEDTFEMPFMNKEESWSLLRKKVFGEEMCPPQLEKAGKKIAENCEGLPLLIVRVADILSKADKTPEYWNKIAADKQNSVFEEAYDLIFEVVHPSYYYLPQNIQACFLHMAVFPQNYEVRRSRLISLWSAEGFLQFMDSVLETCLQHLVTSNVVVVRHEGYKYNRIKAYSLHSVFWHMCKKEARNNKFLHTLNRYADGSVESIRKQRRLSIYKNVLFGIKDVYESIASVSNARSLLCTGAYHQYQVPICFLRLLRVLDALTIRFYEFPLEVLKLVQLRYLALTSNKSLPPSISKLWNLQCLIVHQHLSIRFTLAESYLPVEIWDLQELTYVQIIGRNLPEPPRGVVLKNLLTLLDVAPHSCTKSVLTSIPNLEKLRVQTEIWAPDAAHTMSCFHHVSHLSRLKSFQCVVVNPDNVSPPPPLTVFTSNIKKLTLSGLGYPWKDMSKIAALPLLEVLKLQCYAFRGEKWEPELEPRNFWSLKYLVIEDTDLVQWTSGYPTFLSLSFLTMKNCYKLREIPNISSLLEIQLVDCNPSAVTCAKQMKNIHCNIYVDSSWEDGNLKSWLPSWYERMGHGGLLEVY